MDSTLSAMPLPRQKPEDNPSYDRGGKGDNHNEQNGQYIEEPKVGIPSSFHPEVRLSYAM